MTDSLDDRRKALENDYFRRQEQELIDKMRAKLAADQSGTIAVGEKKYTCPKCGGNLIAGNFENVEIDACDNCGGIWLDAGELRQITEKETGGWFGRLLG